LAAVLLNAMLLKRSWLSAKLLLGERNCEPNAASWNLTFSKVLDGAKRHKIAEAVEPFAPASARTNKS
jgi:hypothetical protein